jgi:hypothetical protein
VFTFTRHRSYEQSVAMTLLRVADSHGSCSPTYFAVQSCSVTFKGRVLMHSCTKELKLTHYSEVMSVCSARVISRTIQRISEVSTLKQLAATDVTIRNGVYLNDCRSHWNDRR